MKQIVDGLKYDTYTADEIAWSDDAVDYGGADYPCHASLYRSPGGAFFVFQSINTGDDGEVNRFIPMSAGEARSWVLSGEIALIDETFLDVPEASATVEARETLYIRLPSDLKRQVEAASTQANVSLNSFVVQTLATATKA